MRDEGCLREPLRIGNPGRANRPRLANRALLPGP